MAALWRRLVVVFPAETFFFSSFSLQKIQNFHAYRKRDELNINTPSAKLFLLRITSVVKFKGFFLPFFTPSDKIVLGLHVAYGFVLSARRTKSKMSRFLSGKTESIVDAFWRSAILFALRL